MMIATTRRRPWLTWTMTLLPTITLVGCGGDPGGAAAPGAGFGSSNSAKTLTEARRGFQTKLARRESANEPVEQPPEGVFQVVRYTSPAGELPAYLTPDPGDGKKHPAIIWITGGDCNTIGDVWSKADPKNDQTAAAYREAGLVMMFPSLRGGNQHPGPREGFLGEVDDVLAAADYLAKQTYVDPKRIYLGGHSTGGTLALLVAESTDRFRAVFAFGPVDSPNNYPDQYVPFNRLDDKELAVRSPDRWLSSVACPTFVLEGTLGNLFALREMARVSRNPLLHFHEIEGADHFNALGPTNKLIASKILKDDGPTTNLEFTADELKPRAGG
ncbi:MAG TPA: prolyl oligopeptidase family serine peptidase [Isosphaeraceae bacterium]|jgi:acetyl esterase/lipase|nr:prolyl oligopeptidase family serine peptidase [Isosphaeraceae bacterium]